jgi:FG-GAP-like repeat
MKLKFSARPAACSPLRLAARVILLLCVAALTAAPALAQMSLVGASKPLFATGRILIGNDVSYDPAHGVYLVVAGYGEQYGVFVNAAGDPVSPAFQIGSANSGAAFGHYPRSEYSRDLNDGQGGFLVTWHQTDGNVLGLHAVVVAYPDGVVSPERVIVDYALGQSRPGAGTGIAYSSTSRQFLVAWTTGGGAPFGIHARLIDTTGAPIGPVIQIANPGGAAEPAVAWNASTDEFAVFHARFSNTGASVTLKRLRASDGVFQGAPTTFGFTGGTFSPEIAVNSSTHNYVVGWSIAPGAMGAELDEHGEIIGAPRLISTRMGTPTSLSLAFNPVSGTFLAVSEGTVGVDVMAVELDSTGVPKTTAVTATSGARNGSFVPRVTARTDAKEWNISFTRDLLVLTNQVIATASSEARSKPDITIYRPDEGTWYSLTAASAWEKHTTVRWGLPSDGDEPINADFDGDGVRDVVVYAPGTGTWSILFSTLAFDADRPDYYQWGIAGDIPMPADFDGDGKADLVVYRPSTGMWYARLSSRNYSYDYSEMQWGLPGDVPLKADFNGDGRADYVVYRPSEGVWFIVYSAGPDTSMIVHQWGIAGDVPMAEDFDGDGKTDLAVYRPSEGTWYIRFSSTKFSYSNWAAYQWGLPGDLPVRGDYDGDGKADLVVYRPSDGTWYFLYSGSAYSYSEWKSYGWGLVGDIVIGGQ